MANVSRPALQSVSGSSVPVMGKLRLPVCIINGRVIARTFPEANIQPDNIRLDTVYLYSEGKEGDGREVRGSWAVRSPWIAGEKDGRVGGKRRAGKEGELTGR